MDQEIVYSFEDSFKVKDLKDRKRDVKHFGIMDLTKYIEEDEVFVVDDEIEELFYD